jgi:hypothetical protein
MPRPSVRASGVILHGDAENPDCPFSPPTATPIGPNVKALSTPPMSRICREEDAVNLGHDHLRGSVRNRS